MTCNYSGVRELISVGDVIGCQGQGLFSRAIRLFRGGEWDLSHVALIIRDVQIVKDGRVEVMEALTKGGMQRNFLSKIYEVKHGKLFWIKMTCTLEQREKIIALGAKVIKDEVKYDFRACWIAVFSKILVDVKKFNCSEFAWYALTEAGRLLKRKDKQGRAIAPVPGNLPTWAGIEPIEIDMGK